nr:MAG: ECF sigma factor [Bacteriophage sp.]
MAGRLSEIEKSKPIDPVKKDIADKWLNYINSIYVEYKNKFEQYCNSVKKKFEEDVYSETIINCYGSICRNGLKDLSEQGMKNYLFQSFKMNVVRNTTYARQTKRTYNVDISEAHEEFLLKNEPLPIKIKKQMLNDFTVTYILFQVENNFDIISFFCFRLKHLIPKMTYQRLRDITNINDCKRRVTTINKWVRDNIDKQEVYKEFIKAYPQFE